MLIYLLPSNEGSLTRAWGAQREARAAHDTRQEAQSAHGARHGRGSRHEAGPT
jgi:hypothetical protein